MAGDIQDNMDNFKSMSKSAFVLGYTGETGKALVQELNRLKIFQKVILIGRREVPLDLGPEFEQKSVDYEKIEEFKEAFQGLKVGFCCLGTTKGTAGADGFVRVDRDYVLMAAEVAKAGGCQHFLTVSAQGANSNSCILYTRTKGEAEDGLRNMNFDRLSVYRPGVIMVDREESRPLEACLRALLKPIEFCCPAWMTIPVEAIAQAMINIVVTPPKNSIPEIYENAAIHQLAGMTRGCCGARTGNEYNKVTSV